jgi:phosphohistidine phosphatase
MAVEPGTRGFTRDADRPLLPEGEERLRDAARAMQALRLEFDMILSSPLVRARQTAEVIAKAFGASKKMTFSEMLTPAGNVEELVDLINSRRPQPEDVLLVGHEPHLSGLISLFLGGEDGISVVMKKGGLCKLAVGTLSAGKCAQLKWLLTPRQLELIAKGR